MAEPRWLSEPQQRAWRSYLRGGRLLMEALDHDLAEHGLALSEYEIISMLSEAPQARMRMSELADLVVQSRSRLTHTASRLERRGWVTRRPCPQDRRGVLIELTDTGRQQLAHLAPIHLQSVRAHLVDVLTPEQFAQLGAAMARVAEHLDSAPPAD